MEFDNINNPDIIQVYMVTMCEGVDVGLNL